MSEISISADTGTLGISRDVAALVAYDKKVESSWKVLAKI